MKLSKKNIIGIIIGLIVIVGIILFLVIKTSHAELLENDIEVEPNSDLTYYLKVKYDGVDKEGVESSDSVMASINSGYITITDKIPDGLTFTGFVTTNNGSIGAVQRSDGTTSCSGYVVDDTNDPSATEGRWNSNNTEYTYHGLHYTVSDRTVTFKVKNIKAGCELTVGIKTKTPATVDDPETTVVEKRRDFYNYASASEKYLTVNSNTVHAYMGSGDEDVYNVRYEYTGTVPTGAPAVPGTVSYAKDSTVGVAANPFLEGYTFSGWATTDATINNGSFTMPANEVVLRGSFTEIDKYTVTYEINGTSPEGYILPTAKEYYPGATVLVDSLKEGDTFGGYKFLGWTTSDVTISEDGDFEMPNKNVKLTGRWEQIKYKVKYQFHPGVLPPNADSLLPEERAYAPGAVVTLASDPTATGYEFLGWYKENNFTMPEEDIVIYGEWKRVTGYFEPTISKTVIGEGTYKAGDKVQFKITITNPESFAIKDIIVKETTEGAKFKTGTGYTISSDHFANIETLAAGASIDLYSEYTVTETDKGTLENVAEIKGALADNYYELKDKEYKARAEFSLKSKIKICKTVTGADLGNTFQFKVSSTGFNTWVTMKKGICKTIIVEPGTYTVTEIIPQENTLTTVSGGITSNGGSITTTSGETYEITFNNTSTKKGFMHSFGRIENVVEAGE